MQSNSFPFNTGFAQQCDLGGGGCLFRIDIYFFLSGEVFEDQALLLTFISAGLHGSGIVGRCNRRAVYPCLCLALRRYSLTLSPILFHLC